MSEAFVWPVIGNGRGAPERPPAEVEAEASARGHAEGFERGLEEGRQAAEMEIAALRERLQEGLQSLDAAVHELRQRELDDLAALAHALCRRVVGVELSTSPETFEHVLSEGLARLDAGAEGAEVHLNPDDYARLHPGYHGTIPMHPDPRVAACGLSVRVASRTADFDPIALVDALFEEVRRDLAG